MVISKPILTAVVMFSLAAGASGAYLLWGTGAEVPVVETANYVLESGANEGAAEAPEVPAEAIAETKPPALAAPVTVTGTEPATTSAEVSRPPARMPPAPEVETLPVVADVDLALVEPETQRSVSLIPALPVREPPTVLAGALPNVVLEDLVVGANSVIGLRMSTTLSSETAVVKDTVEARVSRDVFVGDQVAVPAGSVAVGSVTLVDQGGRLRGPARLSVRFHTLRLPNGTNVEIDSDPVSREGNSPGDESVATIGGSAIGGAIVGGVLGGVRGVIVGGTAGAGAGTAAAMVTSNDPAVLAMGTQVTIRLVLPLAVVVER